MWNVGRNNCIHHLSVIVDVDNIYRPVSITDEEDRIIIWLQHLKKVNIGATVEENEISKLQEDIKFTVQ